MSFKFKSKTDVSFELRWGKVSDQGFDRGGSSCCVAEELIFIMIGGHGVKYKIKKIYETSCGV